MNIIRLEITETVDKTKHRSYEYKFFNCYFRIVLSNALLPNNILEGEDGIWVDYDNHLKLILLDGLITFSSYKEYDSHMTIYVAYEEIKGAFEEIQNYQSALSK